MASSSRRSPHRRATPANFKPSPSAIPGDRVSDLTGNELAHRRPATRRWTGQSLRQSHLRRGSACVPGSSGPPDSGIHRRRPRPHHARRLRPGGRRPVHCRPRRAVVVRRAADRRLRGRAGARGPAARPVRLQDPDSVGRDADGCGPADAGVHRVAARRDRCPRGGRARRRRHVHLGAEAGAALVQAQPGSVGDTADRHLRPTRPGAVGGAVPGAARGRGLDHRISVGGRARSGVDRADAGVGQEHPERPGRRPAVDLCARDVGQRQNRVAATRDPIGLLHSHGHAVLGDRLRADVGPAVPDRRAGAVGSRRGHAAEPFGGRGDPVGSRHRHLHRTPSASTVTAGAGHHREQRRGRGRSCWRCRPRRRSGC